MIRGFIFLFLFCNTAFADLYQVQHWKTQNQIPVYFVSRGEPPMIDVTVIFDAGSRRDDDAYGLASLTSSLLSEGTENMGPDQIAKSFDSVGAVYSADTGRDMTVISLRSLIRKDYFDKAFKTYLSVLSKPTFYPRAIQRIKKQTVDGIKLSQQNSIKVAVKKLYALLYGNQPYGHPVMGTLDSVGSITQQQIIDFYKKYYVKQNTKIVIVGNFTPQQATSIANSIDNILPNGDRVPKLKQSVAEAQNKTIFVPMQVKQNSVVLGTLGISRSNPDYYNLKVAEEIFGGDNLVSILFEELRNKRGLVYSVNSYLTPLDLKGSFITSFQTRANKTSEAVNLTKSLLKDYIQNGPTVNQLSTAKQTIIRALPLKISTNTAALANVINIAFYNLPLNYLAQYPQNIQAVTVKSAQKAFAKIAQLDQLLTVIVGENSSQ